MKNNLSRIIYISLRYSDLKDISEILEMYRVATELKACPIFATEQQALS